MGRTASLRALFPAGLMIAFLACGSPAAANLEYHRTYTTPATTDLEGAVCWELEILLIAEENGEIDNWSTGASPSAAELLEYAHISGAFARFDTYAWANSQEQTYAFYSLNGQSYDGVTFTGASSYADGFKAFRVVLHVSEPPLIDPIQESCARGTGGGSYGEHGFSNPVSGWVVNIGESGHMESPAVEADGAEHWTISGGAGNEPTCDSFFPLTIPPAVAQGTIALYGLEFMVQCVDTAFDMGESDCDPAQMPDAKAVNPGFFELAMTGTLPIPVARLTVEFFGSGPMSCTLSVTPNP